MTWADILVDVAAPQVALAEFNAFLDSVLEEAAWRADRARYLPDILIQLPGEIKAITITGSFTA